MQLMVEISEQAFFLLVLADPLSNTPGLQCQSSSEQEHFRNQVMVDVVDVF